MDETVNIFIGTEPKTEIPRKVLEFSIKKNTNAKVKFHKLMGKGWETNPDFGMGTGFSLLRWSIPERMKYDDFAIYLDADMLVLGDIEEVWNANEEDDDTSLWCTYQKSKLFDNQVKPRTDVMLIDCEEAKNQWPKLSEIRDKLKKDKRQYHKIMHAQHLRKPPGRLPREWNSLDKYDENKGTKLIHYTMENRQPWYNPNHPHAKLWEAHLKMCIGTDIIQKEEIKEACDNYKPHKKGIRGSGFNPYYMRYAVKK